MNYLDYANSTSHGIEVLAIVAGIYFKAYRTKFGLLLFILPLSSFIADSIILYSSLPYYMPIGTIWYLFHLFNILAIFHFIRVFSKKEITLFFLLSLFFSVFFRNKNSSHRSIPRFFKFVLNSYRIYCLLSSVSKSGEGRRRRIPLFSGHCIHHPFQSHYYFSAVFGAPSFE